MRYLLLSAVMAVVAMAAQAETKLPQAHVNSMACLENMGQSTSWGQCLGLIFEPCVSLEVASEAHLTCLQSEREGWTATMRLLQEDVTEAITVKSAEDLAGILSGWINYVSQKCQADGDPEGKPRLAAKQLGCQITELVGLSGEYAACLEGRSTADYCVLKD